LQICKFGQPTGITVEKEHNIYIVDTQIGAVKLLVDTKPTAKFCKHIGVLYDAFGIHRKGQKVDSAPIGQGMENVNIVNAYLNEVTNAVHEAVGKNNTNGPDGTISSKTKGSVNLVATCLRQLNNNIRDINPVFEVDLQSCLTLQVESLHSIHHLKNNDLPHMLEHARSFGNTLKESLKRLSVWSAHYFTTPSSYYPVPVNQIKFSDIPKLEPLPVLYMEKEKKDALREWALAFGKTVKQRNVRQETCSYKAGTMPLYAYEKPQQPHAPVDLSVPEHQLPDEVVESEYDSDSSMEGEPRIHHDNEDKEEEERPTVHDVQHHVHDPLNFLRQTSRVGRKIKINYKFL
jgi:hypothetical protein